MSNCHNCNADNATFDCNGLKFCDSFCFREWHEEDLKSLDEFAKEYKDFYISGTEIK